MPTKFKTVANSISAEVLDSWQSGDKSTFSITGPTVDAFSVGFNNVRLKCTGTSGDGGFDTAYFKFRSSASFHFQFPARTPITAHGYFLPCGYLSARAWGKSWFLDSPGYARCSLWTSLRILCLKSNGSERFSKYSDSVFLGYTEADAGDHGDFDSEVIAPQESSHLSLDSPSDVRSTDTLIVRVRHFFEGITTGGGKFKIRFNDSGDGLNAPWVAVDYD